MKSQGQAQAPAAGTQAAVSWAHPTPGSGSTVAVLRALSVLGAFGLGESQLSLAELSRRCNMHKTTVLRMARTLARAGYTVQREDGAWRLGPACGWLGARYQAGFDVQDVVEPTLRHLSRISGESAAFHVREGDARTCLIRVEGPQAMRRHVRMGEVLPLDKGSPGRVILAFSGEPGEIYETIRARGYHFTIGERDKRVGTVSAPVFGLNWRLLGSVCIAGPVSRMTQTRLRRLAKDVVAAANELSFSLAGERSPQTPRIISKWHPPAR